MGATTIQNLSQACKSTFISILSQRNEVLREFDMIEGIEDEQARFNTWAAYIGVFAGHHSSLDYRLRESESVRSLVKAQLSILYTSQLDILKILCDGNLPAGFPSSLPPEGSDDLESYTESETLGESGAQSDTASDHSGDRTHEDALEDIRSALDRLHRLAKAIRRPSVLSQTSKANNYKPVDEFGNDMIEVFERVSSHIIQAKNSGAPEFLLQRLSRANAVRRRLFLFRRKHQEILSGQLKKTSLRRPSPTQRESQGSDFVTPQADSTSIAFRSTPAVSRATQESQAPSNVAKATTFVESKFQDRSSKAPSSFAGTSVASFLAKSRLPPPPKVGESSQDFECPYCCQLVPNYLLLRKHWRQHLIKDLEPYVCLFDNCSQPDALYRDQGTWIEHLQTHTMKWMCRLPGHSGGSKYQTFGSGEAYAEHLRAQHSKGKSLMQAQIRQFLEFQRPIKDSLPIKACPFCPFTIEDISQGVDASRSSRSSDDLASLSAIASKMQKHVAAHLVSIASYSLPWLDDVDEDVASDRAQSDSDTDFGDVEEGNSHRSADKGSIQTDNTGDLCFDDTQSFSEKAQPDEWTFIPDVPYRGQEFDEVLSPFVRKYHVEVAFADNVNLEPELPYVHMPLSRNQEFYNREDALLYLDNTLSMDQDSATQFRTCALYGPAGIGKTQVATEWTYRNMHKFDAVFWIHADEGSKMNDDINQISVRLGLVDEKSADSDDQTLTRELFRHWLGNPVTSYKTPSNTSKAKWLLILDHVINAKLLDNFWPTSLAHGSIVITSRKPMVWDPSRYPSVTLEPFNPKEGADLMCYILPREVSPEERRCAEIISSKVQGMPYALIHLTKWMAGECLTFVEFLSQDETTEKSKLLKKAQGELAKFAVDDAQSFLETTFESIQEFQPVLAILSMLDPDRISKKVLAVECTGVALQGYPATEQGLDVALKELLKYGLLMESYTGSSTYIMPRIVQETVRKHMTMVYARDIFDTCIMILCAHWPFHTMKWLHGTTRWPQCEELFPHIMRLRRIAPSIKTEGYDVGCGYQYARLWADAGWYCFERGRVGEADEFSALAHNICTKVKEQLHPAPTPPERMQTILRSIDFTLAEITLNRGVYAVEIHEPKSAFNFLRDFNNMMTKEFGDTQRGTDSRLSLSYNELGCAYMLNEEYSRAEECFKTSIEMMRMLDNFESWQTSLPEVNLGVVYQFTGRLEEADEILTNGLRAREKKFGYNDRQSFITGRFLYTLGNLHDDWKNFDLSLEYHQRALNQYRNTLGSGHHRTADTYVRITRHFMRMGNIDKALDFIDRSIQIYGFDTVWKAELARARFWKSRVLRACGRTEEADMEYNHSITLYREIEGQSEAGPELDEDDFDARITFWSR